MIESKNLSTESGIYFLYDLCGNLLYIGKASNLQSRISGHIHNWNIFPFEDELDLITFLDKAKKVNVDSFELDDIKDFKSLFSCMGSFQIIDIFLEKAESIRIGFIGLKGEELETKEKELILSLRPPFNKETMLEEYKQVRKSIQELYSKFTYNQKYGEYLRNEINKSL